MLEKIIEACEGEGCGYQPHALVLQRFGRSGCLCLDSHEASVGLVLHLRKIVIVVRVYERSALAVLGAENGQLFN